MEFYIQHSHYTSPKWAASMNPQPDHFKRIHNHISNTLIAQKPKWGSFYEPTITSPPQIFF